MKITEICKNIPAELIRVQRVTIINERTQASYNKRMQALSVERDIYVQCKHQRTQKRVRNTFSTDEAGTVGMCMRTKRFAGSYIHVCTKGQKKYY